MFLGMLNKLISLLLFCSYCHHSFPLYCPWFSLLAVSWLALVPEDSRDNSCVRCEQVNDLLSLVAELKEEVERLRNIRECESRINCWSHTLPSLRPRQQVVAPEEAEDPLSSCHQAGGDLGEGGKGNRCLLRAAGKSPHDLPHLCSCSYTTDMGLWNLKTRHMSM